MQTISKGNAGGLNEEEFGSEGGAKVGGYWEEKE
jgi:hypothetical protein